MKKIFYLIAFMAVASFTFTGCKKDDENPSYSFKDQSASGKIGNTAWTISSGRADVSTDDISIDLFSETGTPACDIFISDENQVLFTVPNKVGVYELNLDFSGKTGQTATLLEADGYMNNIATKGAIEITSISETEVKGKVDIRSDGENFINGNFTAVLCE